MVTTVSQLKVGPVIMSPKHHTFYSSTRQLSSNNFFFLKKKLDENNFNRPNFPKLRVVFPKSHSILRCELSNNCSKANIFPTPILQKDPLFDVKKFINPCSIQKLFDDSVFNGPLVPVLEKLSRKFASLLLFGVLIMMGMALGSRDSALAASTGRVGERISNSRSFASCSCRYPFDTYESTERRKVLANLTILMLLIIFVWGYCRMNDGSVLMLQVGILDNNRELLRKLNILAQTADISTSSQGLIHMLQEVSKALGQHYDSCHFTYFFEKYSHTMEVFIKPCYWELIMEERARYEKETLMNVDGVKSKTTAVDKANSIENEYTVVTVLVVARGEFSFPKRRFKRALQTFCSVPITKIVGMQVLWNPHFETISEQQLRENFPLMKCYKTDVKKRS